MANNHEEENGNSLPANEKTVQEKAKQEQSDPQITELRGLTDPSEDLEPTLTDGNKSPDNT